MPSSSVEAHRAGHEAFNRRDFQAMTEHYADDIAWTDHSQGRTFRTPQEFKTDFLPGWVQTSADIRVTDPHYFDAGQAVVCTFTVVGTHDGPLGPFPATGKPSRCRCVSCGTSTRAGGSLVGTSTTTRSRCSPNWA